MGVGKRKKDGYWIASLKGIGLVALYLLQVAAIVSLPYFIFEEQDRPEDTACLFCFLVLIWFILGEVNFTLPGQVLKIFKKVVRVELRLKKIERTLAARGENEDITDDQK